MDADTAQVAPYASPRWKPLESLERRVLGVLVEKAKTTPENYPLSLNALRNGCNQKNNRAPLMQVEEDQVESAIETLRHLGAVAVIQGSGRVDKYRHLAYEWLGVEKVELAVMAELLLRGAQTIGELRGRAARMEPINDLADLRPVLDALQAKKLIVYLTPPGRGCVVTHALYQDRELEKLRREAATMSSAEPDDDDDAPTSSAVAVARSSPPRAAAGTAGVEAEVARLRDELASVKRELAAVREAFDSASQHLQEELDQLKQQLGC